MREILVFGEKTFKITVEDDSRLTFGPWSPPSEKDRGNAWGNEAKRGTLRVYGKGKDDILAVFSGVLGFRDLSLGYAEEVAREEGATIWKDDEKGYVRDHKFKREYKWVKPELPELPEPSGRDS